MVPALRHRALYAAFDRFPSRKGSAVHIDRFARTLFEQAGGGLLYVLGGDGLPPYQREGEIEIVRYSREAAHLLERASGFSARLATMLEQSVTTYGSRTSATRGAAYRSSSDPGAVRTIYEVNGLPSIELPFQHPAIPARDPRADRGPSSSGASSGRARDHPVAAHRRAAGRAGVERRPAAGGPQRRRRPRRHRRRRHPTPRALSPVLRRAPAVAGHRHGAARLREAARPRRARARDLRVGPSAPRQAVSQARAGISASPTACAGISRCPSEELASWREHALISLAPLRDCSRNSVQGCAPLKILESMAAGVPVIASDLPVVRELISDGVQGGSSRRTARRARARDPRAARLPADARGDGSRRPRADRGGLSWERSTARLRELYGAHGLGTDWIPPIDIAQEAVA